MLFSKFSMFIFIFYFSILITTFSKHNKISKPNSAKNSSKPIINPIMVNSSNTLLNITKGDYTNFTNIESPIKVNSSLISNGTIENTKLTSSSAFSPENLLKEPDSFMEKFFIGLIFALIPFIVVFSFKNICPEFDRYMNMRRFIVQGQGHKFSRLSTDENEAAELENMNKICHTAADDWDEFLGYKYFFKYFSIISIIFYTFILGIGKQTLNKITAMYLLLDLAVQ